MLMTVLSLVLFGYNVVPIVNDGEALRGSTEESQSQAPRADASPPVARTEPAAQAPPVVEVDPVTPPATIAKQTPATTAVPLADTTRAPKKKAKTTEPAVDTPIAWEKTDKKPEPTRPFRGNQRFQDEFNTNTGATGVAGVAGVPGLEGHMGFDLSQLPKLKAMGLNLGESALFDLGGTMSSRRDRARVQPKEGNGYADDSYNSSISIDQLPPGWGQRTPNNKAAKDGCKPPCLPRARFVSCPA